MNTKLAGRSILAIALGGWAALASALSLGPLTGTAVVGQPVELVAPVQFDAVAQGNGSGCVTAEVRYGDKVVDQARVDVALNADAGHQLSYARISSALPLDEPFVTVVLNAGCGQRFSRRYVLLADAPSQQPVALAVATSLGRPAASGAATPLQATRVAGAAARPRDVSPVRRVAAFPREAAPLARGRLQLAVWDPSRETLPWLRSSTELKSSPTEDAARRAAASSLWRALNAQPQDLLRSAERLRGLEGEVNSLRGLSARHRAEIASARQSLDSDRSRGHTSLLLVTLLALLAGSTGAVLWHRSRRQGQGVGADSWYAPLEPGVGAHIAIDQEREPAAAPARKLQAESPAPVPLPPIEVADDPRPARPSEPVRAPPPLAPLAVTLTEPAPPAASPVHESGRPGHKVDALHAAQQQAEFFASLGQIDEAVAVLTSYLEDSRERPVLAFLELFNIYHGTGRRTEYEALQSTFRQLFAMDVASFGEYKDEPRELDLYLLPVTRIASAWPSERSEEIIEELLFKRPASPRDLLSLQAYRDLVWLYALGQEVVHNTGSPAGLQLQGDRGLPNDHFILPWAAGEQEQPNELSLDRLNTIDVAPEHSSFGVDIDLTTMRGDGDAGNEVHLAHPDRDPLTDPGAPPAPDLDAFDAAMASERRRHP